MPINWENLSEPSFIFASFVVILWHASNRRCKSVSKPRIRKSVKAVPHYSCIYSKTMNQGGTILSITVSCRAVGMAIADNLGLVDAECLNLHDCQNQKERCDKARQWLRLALGQVNPECIVLEDLHFKRLTKDTKRLQTSLENELNQNFSGKLWKVSRRKALKSFQTEKTQQECIRRLATVFSRTCPLLYFHPAPDSQIRTEWDRSWGQAVVAAALAIYIKNEKL